MVSHSPVAAVVLEPLEPLGPKPAAEEPGKNCESAPGGRRNRKENTGPSPPVPVLEAPPEHASMVQVEGARFRDKPVDACLKGLAMVHSANRTGFLDWFESSAATGQPLDQICDAFCDNIMCRVIVPVALLGPGRLSELDATSTASQLASLPESLLAEWRSAARPPEMRNIRGLTSVTVDEAIVG